MLETGNSFYVNYIFLNNPAGAPSKIIGFDRFLAMQVSNGEAAWRFRGA